MLAQRKGPWQGTNVQGEIRRAFDLVLLPLGKADKALLPARMDKNFRRRMEGQIELLQRRKLCRDIRMTDIVPLPKNSFRHWNDDGREWRESVLQCSALERLLSPKEGRPIYTIYRKNARLRLLQSRHVRSCDRAGKQTSCYAHKGTISCPSCGAEVELRSQQTVCPYCGGVIQSDFYDWQTEAFEVYEQMGANQQRVLLLLLWGALQYVCLFLCLWLIRNTMISLAAGLGSAVLVLAAVIAVSTITYRKQEKLEEEIVRYSENYLRSCISEALYQNVEHPDLMDYGVGTIRLKKVVNTVETTTITVQVYISETYLKEPGIPNGENRTASCSRSGSAPPAVRISCRTKTTAAPSAAIVSRPTVLNGWCRQARYERNAVFQKKDYPLRVGRGAQKSATINSDILYTGRWGC